MSYWVKIDTNDGNKVVGVAYFGDPADRTQLDDGAGCEHRPQDASGLAGAAPHDIFGDPENPAFDPLNPTYLYRWNGTDDIELIP